jgi:hypothetical protein
VQNQIDKLKHRALAFEKWAVKLHEWHMRAHARAAAGLQAFDFENDPPPPPPSGGGPGEENNGGG